MVDISCQHTLLLFTKCHCCMILNVPCPRLKKQICWKNIQSSNCMYAYQLNCFSRYTGVKRDSLVTGDDSDPDSQFTAGGVRSRLWQWLWCVSHWMLVSVWGKVGLWRLVTWVHKQAFTDEQFLTPSDKSVCPQQKRMWVRCFFLTISEAFPGEEMGNKTR